MSRLQTELRGSGEVQFVLEVNSFDITFLNTDENMGFSDLSEK